MADLLTKNHILAAKIEATPGTDAVPTVGADAILVENPRPAPELETIQTNEVSGGLDGRGPIVGGGSNGFTFDVPLKGSGAGATPPEIGTVLRMCAMSETILAAAETGTAQAGAAGSITLAVGASATDGLYVGQPVILTGGTGAGQTRIVTAYDGTTKIATVTGDWTVDPDGTTTYEIPVNTLYKPASAGLEVGTLYDWQRNKVAAANAKLTKVLGAAGTFTLNVPARGIGRASFQLTGQFVGAPTDVADPGAATYDATRPRPFIAAGSFIGAAAAKVGALDVAYGGEVGQPDNPTAAFGFDPADVTARRITGTVTPHMVLASARNLAQDWLDGTPRALAFFWGATAGNRVAVYVPAATFTAHAPDDARGFAIERVAFEAAGLDSGLQLCFY